MIKLIWAMTDDMLIGKDNKIPWHCKKDLLYFKNKTKGQTVLMGENTYDSLKSYYKDKPLPYGKIYIASLSDRTFPDAIKINNIVDFFFNTKEDIWVVGGKTIYEMSLPFADELYIRYIHGHYEGNVYFPRFDFNLFTPISYQKEKECTFVSYKRKERF